MLAGTAAIVAAAFMISARPTDGILTKDGGTTVVNTSLLAKDVRGFKGATPVRIHIKKNKITQIEALPNQETPRYFAKAKKMLAKYEGMTVTKAAKADVDGVTGATFSSTALKKNVKAGLEYYKKHK